MSVKKNDCPTGVIVLLISSIFVKIFGMIFKIPLQYLIGNEGMGYFNISYNIYSYLFLLSTSSLPAALGIVISELYGRGLGRLDKKLFFVTLRAFLVLGSALSLICAFFARPLAVLLGVGEAYRCIVLMSPSLAVLCVTSCIRGYFQGHGIMTVTAVSQLIEAACKALAGTLFAYRANAFGLDAKACAAYTMLGVTLGSLASLFYCIFAYRRFKPSYSHCKNEDISSSVLFKKLLSVSLPLTLSSSIMSLTSLIDSSTSIRRLISIGYGTSEATAVFGNYSTLAVSMFNLPSVLYYPILSSLTPSLSSSSAQGNEKACRNIICSCLKLTFVFSLPCTLGLAALPEPVLGLIFDRASSHLCAPMLACLSPSVFFLALCSVNSCILQGMGKQRLPIISMSIGCAIKLISSHVLTAHPSIGKYGIPLSSCLCYFTCSVISTVFVIKATRCVPNLKKTALLPLLASLLCVLCARRIYVLTSYTLLSVCVAAMVYATFIIVFKCIDKNEISLIISDRLLKKVRRKENECKRACRKGQL